ncbi:BTAD domain-containing putative transcriptional regulator [Embleya hyalina]|uniref:SARP family transcriptional regulator n=1 Tax=Embleya hyalina TaxID=516124 RepID=A0A401YD57_9ACTN|nr:BTAD domain-containing putative transcriptional regulator [Embleya hyalina]GCD92534.1 SARP family transcriptional regulator [Embleya hyalina]
MRYGVLGPLMVWDDEGTPVRVPEAKVRALLADLLVHEGRPVSTDRLVDDLWGAEPPGNPVNALQAKVSQLRRVLGRERVVYQPPGYRLAVDAEADDVDADRFRSLVAEARLAGDPTARAALLTRALGLWRGSAYADFADTEFARTAARRLTEQRLAVLEEQAEARLEVGEHTLLSGELTDLVARHPLRERLRAVQVRALYLAGRQSEALASYADLRRLLADELGVDPGRELTALYEAILRQDPTLTPTGAGTTPGGRASTRADASTQADASSGAGAWSGIGATSGVGAWSRGGATQDPTPTPTGSGTTPGGRASSGAGASLRAVDPSGTDAPTEADASSGAGAWSRGGATQDPTLTPTGSGTMPGGRASSGAGASPRAVDPSGADTSTEADASSGAGAWSRGGATQDPTPTPTGNGTTPGGRASSGAGASPRAVDPSGTDASTQADASSGAGAWSGVGATSGVGAWSGGGATSGVDVASGTRAASGAGSLFGVGTVSGAGDASRIGDSSGPGRSPGGDDGPPSRLGGASEAVPAPVSGAKAAARGRARSNLPAPLTTLVGRDSDVGEVGRLLGGARLVTLTGPGGVGKTRLAVEAAGWVPADLADEVWLVELAGQHGEMADLVQVVAAALGIRDDTPAGLPGHGSPEHPADRLAAALRDRRPLLVLDNCEHVVEPAARLTEVLLHRVPGLRVLATGQEPLGLTGETLFLVEPLRPEDAVDLFAARAAAAAPGFSLDAATPELRASVAEICRRLDGIPLALELAAARVRVLGVAELAARLGDRFRVLTSGRRGAPARQRTLRAMIDWSWELLDTPERIVLRRLAIHTDGCTLDAAEAVCAGDGVTRGEVLDLVGRLVDRSLVVVVPGPAGPRYRMLESVTAYALERLDETADLADVRDRHLRHYLDLAERAEPHLRGAEQRAWLDRFDAEAGNLRAALDEAIRQAGAGRPEGSHAAARLVRALAWWWLLRGRLVEGRRALAAVRAIAPADRAAGAAAAAAETGVLDDAFALLTGDRSVPTAFPDAAIEDRARRGRLAWLYAYALFNGGDPVASARANTHALALAARDEDRWAEAAGLGLRAMHALIGGNLADVARDGLRGAELFRELGDIWGELQTVAPLATIAEVRGDYPEAVRRHTEGLRIAEELRLPTEISARLSGLGRLALLAGDPDRAHDLHRRALDSAVEQGYVFGEVHARMGLALGARRSGDLDAAEAHLLRMLDRYADVSSRAGTHLRRSELGFVAELRGDADAARAHHLLGLELAGVLGEPRAMALSLEGLAGAAALSGDPDRAAFAALLLGAADAIRRGVDAPLPPGERTDVDRITAATTATLGPRAFAEAYERGTTLDPNAATHLVRTTPPPA